MRFSSLFILMFTSSTVLAAIELSESTTQSSQMSNSTTAPMASQPSQMGAVVGPTTQGQTPGATPQGQISPTLRPMSQKLPPSNNVGAMGGGGGGMRTAPDQGQQMVQGSQPMTVQGPQLMGLPNSSPVAGGPNGGGSTQSGAPMNAAVPEPATLAIWMFFASCGLLLVRYRKRG